MVKTDSSSENALLCPSCGALNSPKTLICASCGVSLADFWAALPRIRDLQDEQAAIHREQLKDDVSLAIADGMDRGKRQVSLQLGAALGIAAVLAILIVIGTAGYARIQRLRQEQLAAQYNAAMMCLENDEYLCARDEFEALLQEQPDYNGAQDRLNDARYGLAQQYVKVGQWELAVAELDALLQERPDDERALALLQETYERWIQDAAGRKEWFTALRIMMQRDARFAPKD